MRYLIRIEGIGFLLKKTVRIAGLFFGYYTGLIPSTLPKQPTRTKPTVLVFALLVVGAAIVASVYTVLFDVCSYESSSEWYCRLFLAFPTWAQLSLLSALPLALVVGVGVHYFKKDMRRRRLEHERNEHIKQTIAMLDQGSLADKLRATGELETIVTQDFNEQLRVKSALAALIRRHAPFTPPEEDDEPVVCPPLAGEQRECVQAALNVIGMCEVNDPDYNNKIELQNTNLQRMTFQGNFYNVDLSAAYLTEADMSRANLQHAFITCAYLHRTNLADADLRRAFLSGSELTGASFVRANMKETDLEDAICRQTDFSEADLSQAELDCADLQTATLDGAVLRRATYSDDTLFPVDFNPNQHGMKLTEE